jgi:hypothetical protein
MYKWEKESLEKYGKESTDKLIKNQQEYEKINPDNDCNYCGIGNEGTIIEFDNGSPYIMHYGLWSNGRCKFCGKED